MKTNLDFIEIKVDFIEKKVGIMKKNSNMALLRFRSHGLLLSKNYSQSPTKQLNKSGST